VVFAPHPSSPVFRSYVAIGNSITAGFQSDGINDSTQALSFAVLVARQMNTRFAFPAVTSGCRPPLANFQTMARVADPAKVPCARTAKSVTATLNNVAVPGAASIDPTAQISPNGNAFTDLFLGGETQVARAIEARPTFVSIWIGNDDALGPALSGVLTGLTPIPTFAANYSVMVSQLRGGAPDVKGVLIGVVQVTNAPILFSAAALQSPGFVASLSAAAGTPIMIDPATCTATTTSLISLQIVTAIKAGLHPPTIACAKTALGIGDVFVIDAAEQAQLTAAVDGYNSYIRSKADSIGFGYYDPNAVFDALKATGAIPSIPNLASATTPFGQFVSLDGIHPSSEAHVLIANGLLQAINARFQTSLPLIPLN
jgi:lysophospholipase L1-like esterase